MPEASSRILLDRSVIRLDGRPFFSFGPRILLTPPEGYLEVMQRIADAGFTVVGSPPCSPGTTHSLQAFFDAADQTGLLVVLMADPRLPDHGRYMAERFRTRDSLHSYVLPPRPADRQSLQGYLRERDALRAHDLFHPIFIPLEEDQNNADWLGAQDIYCPATDRRLPGGRLTHQRAGRKVAALRRVTHGSANRPFFCTDLRVCTSDEERRLGLYADDPWVARLPPAALDWYPYLANFMNTGRRDLLGPDPELLRLQVYELLQTGTRGILLDFYEAMGGTLPCTGRDRFCEASILAQEISTFRDFFGEGQIEGVDVETGHPRLSAVVLRHGLDYLIVLRMKGYEEDYFIDEAAMERTEISVMLPGETETISAWRMDFPEARPLEVLRDAAGSLRFLAGGLELTGLVMLTPGTQRSNELAASLATKLARVARLAVEEAEIRFAKCILIESELRQLSAGVNNRDRIKLVQKAVEESRAALQAGDMQEAFTRARRGQRLIRQIIKYQMARALTTSPIDTQGLHPHLGRNYFTLPSFYRQTATEAAKAFSDLT